MTTHDQVNYTEQPLLFHLGRDPGEKYVIQSVSCSYCCISAGDCHVRFAVSHQTAEYEQAMVSVRAAVAEHKQGLKQGDPQLNYCDPAVMVICICSTIDCLISSVMFQNWAPPGCETLDNCLPVPPHHKTLCVWDH